MAPTATARENVKVTVRLRPPNETELSRTDYNIWDVDSNEHRLSLEQNFAEKNRKQLSGFFYGMYIVQNHYNHIIGNG